MRQSDASILFSYMRTIRYCMPFTVMLFYSMMSHASFIIEEVVFHGLNRLSTATASAYMPIGKGDEASKDNLSRVVNRFNRSGLFEDVQIYGDERNVLFVHLKERPTISKIAIEGNELIEEEQLRSVLQLQGISLNRTFSASVFGRMRRELQNQYFQAGYYAVRVNTKVEYLERQRVSLLIEIDEGSAAKIEQISFTGNHSASDKLLLTAFQTQSYDPNNALLGNFEYQKFAVEGDFNAVLNYYWNNGYAKAGIRSSQVSLSPDQQSVYITVNLEEGALYHIEGSRIEGVDRILQPEQIDQINTIQSGDVFSRRKISAVVDALRKALGNQGYAYANIQTDIGFNEEKQQAFIRFIANPGERVYVHRVEITGNYATLDAVVRREMRQFEGALYIPALVQLSEARINRAGYFNRLSISPRRISNNQVLLLVEVEETNTGSFNAQVGFSLVGGVRFGIGLTERNWLGRGYIFNFSAQQDSAVTQVGISATDPYFTPENVSFTWALNYSRTDAGELNLSAFLTNRISASFRFGLPLTETQRIGYGVRFDRINLICQSEFTNCVSIDEDFPDGINSVIGVLRWSMDTRNRALFPTGGSQHTITAEPTLPGTDIQTLGIDSLSRWYFPINFLNEGSAFNITHQIRWLGSYDDSAPPFFNHYFLGGPSTVRGYRTNTLGPQYNEATDGTTGAQGGTVSLRTNFEVLIPPFFSDSIEQQSSIRFGPFVDIGNLYSSLESVDIATLRGSYGVAMLWVSPFGPLSFSIAQPFNNTPSDQTEFFQFSLGQGF